MTCFCEINIYLFIYFFNYGAGYRKMNDGNQTVYTVDTESSKNIIEKQREETRFDYCINS